jgi:hypothetical protein
MFIEVFDKSITTPLACEFFATASAMRDKFLVVGVYTSYFNVPFTSKSEVPPAVLVLVGCRVHGAVGSLINLVYLLQY